MTEDAIVKEITDSIPRASVEQALSVIEALAEAGGQSTFEQIRNHLHRKTSRKAAPTREAMWTVARDVTYDLQRLGYVEAGVLPRKRSEVIQIGNAPCALNEKGKTFSQTIRRSKGQAYDELLVGWMNTHPYFRFFTIRLLKGPLYVPQVTKAEHAGLEKGKNFPDAASVVESCASRLAAVDFPAGKMDTFRSSLKERLAKSIERLAGSQLSPRQWIDEIEGQVVLPAFLLAEELPFDAVTFQHLITVSQDFLSADWTASLPMFDGRVFFSTCEFRPLEIAADAVVEKVVHHGKGYSKDRFAEVLLKTYRDLTGAEKGYVNVYPIRAHVCITMGIPPAVFSMNLEDLIREGAGGTLEIYTELPFGPPPFREPYVECAGRRIEMIKIVSRKGD